MSKTITVQVTLHIVWNEDGDVVGYPCEETARQRLVEDYGGTVIGSTTRTIHLDLPYPALDIAK